MVLPKKITQYTNTLCFFMGFGNQLITGVPDLEVKIYAYFFSRAYCLDNGEMMGMRKNGYMMGM